MIYHTGMQGQCDGDSDHERVYDRLHGHSDTTCIEHYKSGYVYDRSWSPSNNRTTDPASEFQ